MKHRKWEFVFILLLVSGLTIAGALAYKRWPQLFKKLTEQKRATPANEIETSSVPPFSTKEPERYQATRVITSVEFRNGAADSAPETVTTKMLIARDGEKRREEHNNGAAAAMVYLEIPMGRFALLPSKKLYADLNLASDLDSLDPQSDIYSEFSPERLLNETRTIGVYENLGAETLNGRSTTKYRATTGDSTNGAEGGSLTLIWIDDALAMPIRSETISASGDHSSKLTVELRDIKQEVDPQLFALPRDYKKVDYLRLRAEIPQIRDAQGSEKKEPEKR